MVKNTKGGKGAKALSRRLATTTDTSFVRIPVEGEFFALVTHMFGNMCRAVDLNNNSFDCFIRGKFRGRNKRSSFITVGCFIIAGTRDFASSTTKCDVVEVFENSQLHALFALPSFPSSLLSMASANAGSHVQQDIEFDVDAGSTNPSLRTSTTITTTITEDISEDENPQSDDLINIDDI
jgi:hypothetical protein